MTAPAVGVALPAHWLAKALWQSCSIFSAKAVAESSVAHTRRSHLGHLPGGDDRHRLLGPEQRERHDGDPVGPTVGLGARREDDGVQE
jgi:hypothetical protein